MLIPLICKQCGGKLEVEQSLVFESGDTVTVLSDQTFTCAQCGTKYLPGEKVKRALGNSSINISGGVNNTNIVIGTGNIISNSPIPTNLKDGQENKRPVNLQSEIKASKQQPPKKWWQFWKM